MLPVASGPNTAVAVKSPVGRTVPVKVVPPVSASTKASAPGVWVTVPVTAGGVPVSPHVLSTVACTIWYCPATCRTPGVGPFGVDPPPQLAPVATTAPITNSSTVPISFIAPPDCFQFWGSQVLGFSGSEPVNA